MVLRCLQDAARPCRVRMLEAVFDLGKNPGRLQVGLRCVPETLPEIYALSTLLCITLIAFVVEWSALRRLGCSPGTTHRPIARSTAVFAEQSGHSRVEPDRLRSLHGDNAEAC